jgi:hypothetical protein
MSKLARIDTYIKPAQEFVSEVVAKIDNPRMIVVVVQDSAGSWYTFFQHAKPSEIAFAALLLNDDALKRSRVSVDDDAGDPPQSS